MYVLGFVYDKNTGTFVRTGILAARVEPKHASISLNGKIVSNESADIKFLKPGEYELSFAAPGYQTWNKRLSVYANQVTWSNTKAPKVSLFKTMQKPDALAQATQDFFTDGSRLFYLTAQELRTGTLKNAGDFTAYPLPKTVTTITPSPSGKFLLLTSTATATPTLLVFDISSNKISNLSDKVQSGFVADFSGSDELFVLSHGTLFKIIWKVPEVIPVFQNVSNFAIRGNDIYFIATTGQMTTLQTANTASLEEQTIYTPFPNFSQPNILVTDQREVFILTGKTLYKVNSSLERLAENVENCHLEHEHAGMLLCTYGGELGYYTGDNKQLSLITRSQQAVTAVGIRSGMGYALFIRDKEIVAAELDTRDRQNQFVVYQGTNPTKTWIDQTAKHMVVLDGTTLYSLQIR